MKKSLILALLIILLASVYFFFFQSRNTKVINPLSTLIEKPFDKYTFENLKKKKFKASEITIGKILKKDNNFTSYMFYYTVDGKKVSGLINIPNTPGTYPVIAMFRGFVEKEKFTTGEGTRNTAQAFAQNGFITLAPDFLDYGESASPSANGFEDRFLTYETAITLLESIPNLNKALTCHPELVSGSLSQNKEILNQVQNDKECMFGNVQADANKVGIWGHSNGGHIALSVLEITGKDYPTVLWNPVSKPFPYSILFFTDQYKDHGKALRKALADFENSYDAEKYSPANFFNWIKAPIQLHQGGIDDQVPQAWSDLLNFSLQKLDKDISYFTYPGENHNFTNGGWDLAVQRSINFYKNKLNYNSL